MTCTGLNAVLHQEWKNPPSLLKHHHNPLAKTDWNKNFHEELNESLTPTECCAANMTDSGEMKRVEIYLFEDRGEGGRKVSDKG